jgi:hypothetical protein
MCYQVCDAARRLACCRRGLCSPPLRCQERTAARESLLADDDFVSAIARATADEERVTRRLALARAAFQAVK